MTIYTDSPGVLTPRPISDLPSSLSSSVAAEFKSGFQSGPFDSLMRYSDAQDAATNQNSPIVSQKDAQEFAKSIGVNNVEFPASGTRQSYLDYLQKKSQENAKTQQTLAAAPTGLVSTPVRFLANLAGNAIDPANIALMMVPGAGEAKATTMLGRFGQRALTGAEMGLGQSAVAVPFNAMATASEGGDYTVGDAAGQLFMGALTGGLMHASGGLIKDMVKKAKTPAAEEAQPEAVQPEGQAPETPQNVTDADAAAQPMPPFSDNGMSPAQMNLQTALSGQGKEISDYAYNTAYNDIVPDWREAQQTATGGMIRNVADLKAQLADNNRTLSTLDDSLQDRIESYQAQNLKFKAAKAQALKDIESDRQTLNDQNDQINQQLQANAAGEQAKGNLSALDRGQMPQELADKIDARAQEITKGLQQTPLAQGVKTAAQVMRDQPWEVQQQTMRSAVAQMLRGEDPNVQPFIDLSDPAKRDNAIESLKQPAAPTPDPNGVRASKSATAQVDAVKNTADFDQIKNDAEHEMEILQNLAGDDPELNAEINAIRDDSNDETITNGIKKLATCAMRFI